MRNKPSLTAADARRMADACRAEAGRAGWAVTIAIVDDGGHLLHLERLDARLSTLAVAIAKARTAALSRQPTASLAARVRDNPGLLALDAMPIQGGVPVMYAGECVGAIGVSGVTPEQDEQVASAGCGALQEAGS
jgi:glc operon protein GlcG